MDLFFGIGNVCIGLMMTLIGFKVYYPFEWKGDKEMEEKWNKKWGKFFKFGGIVVLLVGTLKTLENI